MESTGRPQKYFRNQNTSNAKFGDGYGIRIKNQSTNLQHVNYNQMTTTIYGNLFR